MDGNNIKDELIDFEDFVVYTDEPELLARTEDLFFIEDGKNKKIKYKEAPPGVVAAGQFARQFTPEIMAGIRQNGVLGSAIGWFFTPNGQKFVKLVGDKATEKARSMFEKGSNNTNTTGTGGGKKGGKSNIGGNVNVTPSKNSAAASMFTNLPPLTTVINTPISKLTLSEDLAQTKLGEPNMHIVGARFALQVSEPDDVIYKWFNEVIAPDFQNLASLSVNYGLNAETVFSTDNLITYINTVAYALQVYYFYVSILSYESNIPHNKNAGMRWLRSKITQDNIYELEALSRTLRSLPIPPRLNDVCFFLQQPFKNSDCAFSSICKFMPFGFDSSTGNFPVGFGTYDSNTSIIQNCVDNLNTTALNTLSTKLANIVPDWLDMTMYSPGPLPVFNLTLCDIWANAPSVQQDFKNYGSAKYNQVFPCWPGTTGDENTNYHYVSKSDSPDAIAIALAGGWKSTLRQNATSTVVEGLRPGLLGPMVSYYQVNGSNFMSTNVFTFINHRPQDNIPYWTPMSFDNSYNGMIRADIGRSFHATNPVETTYSTFIMRPAGYDSLSYVSLATIRHSAKQLAEWIMNLETMQAKAEAAIKKRSPYNSKGTKLKT